MVAYRLDISQGDCVDNKFCVIKKIGSGSYGDVFLVETANKQTYALKLLRLWEVPSELHQNLTDRFNLEYQTARIQSEYLIHTLDYGMVKGNPYFLMEYCEGGDLSKRIGTETISIPQIAYDILHGLHDLHREGKVHRDLKPENVLIRKNGHAALTDFGVVGDKSATKRLTGTNIFGKPKQIFGTYLYMAPEQAERKGGGVTYLPTIDIFSFGVMLYELLTNGCLPFGKIERQEDLAEYQDNAKNGRWNKDMLRVSQEKRAWLPIVNNCLIPDYRQRYQSAYDVMKDIKPFVGNSRLMVVDDRKSRSPRIEKLIVTQGENLGRVYVLSTLLQGKRRMLRIGRSDNNDIVLPESMSAYLSRFHFTLERSLEGNYWKIKDGQWQTESRSWQTSTNGTYLNSTPVTKQGLKVFTGDIITAGEYKIKVE